MKILSLLKREPFDSIFEATLEEFLTEYYKKPFKVKWYKSYLSIFRIWLKQDQVWLCNPWLNAIFTNTSNSNVLDVVKVEFSTHPRAWRNLFQKIYVFLALGKISRLFFSRYVIEFHPSLPDADNVLIIGGNHKIRLINPKDREVYTILKSGFDKAYITKELEVRQKYQQLPIPSLKNVGENHAWFCEEYIVGTPLNRLEDKFLSKEKMNEATGLLYGFLTETQKYIESILYLSQLYNKIDAAIMSSHLLSSSKREEILSKAKDLYQILTELKSFDLPTSQTHGDFQPGNILFDGKKIWVIDWEYTDRRQSAYDPLVLFLDSRRPYGISDRIKSVMNGGFVSEHFARWMEWEDRDIRKFTLGVYVLEDLLFYVDENKNDVFSQCTDGSRLFLAELPLLVEVFYE